MPSFRFYRLTAAGRIVSGDWIEAENLDAAEAMVRDLCRDEPYRFEIWQGAVRLRALGPGGAAHREHDG